MKPFLKIEDSPEDHEQPEIIEGFVFEDFIELLARAYLIDSDESA
jgi:hypothetical protein